MALPLRLLIFKPRNFFLLIFGKRITKIKQIRSMMASEKNTVTGAVATPRIVTSGIAQLVFGITFKIRQMYLNRINLQSLYGKNRGDNRLTIGYINDMNFCKENSVIFISPQLQGYFGNQL